MYILKNSPGYIAISELPEKQQEPFKKWLFANGQTQPCVEGYKDGDCAYDHDYELWLSYYTRFQKKTNII